MIYFADIQRGAVAKSLQEHKTLTQFIDINDTLVNVYILRPPASSESSSSSSSSSSGAKSSSSGGGGSEKLDRLFELKFEDHKSAAKLGGELELRLRQTMFLSVGGSKRNGGKAGDAGAGAAESNSTVGGGGPGSASYGAGSDDGMRVSISAGGAYMSQLDSRVECTYRTAPHRTALDGGGRSCNCLCN